MPSQPEKLFVAGGIAPSPAVVQLHYDLNEDLERIARRFLPGTKLTLVVRSPLGSESSLVASDDNLDDAIAEIRRRQMDEVLAAAAARGKQATQVQLDTLAFMRSYMSEHGGVPPTLREMAAHFGLSSIKAVHDRLVALEKKGLAQRMPATTRNWRPV